MATIIESARLGGYITKFENTNFSPAKTAHSFGKEQRFPTVVKHRNQQIGYNMPSTLVTRTTGFGHGQRFVTPDNQRSTSPPCNKYDIPSDFDSTDPNSVNYGKTKRGMYSFGISREFYKNVYIPEAKQNRDVDIPGPGTYNSKYKTLGSEGKKWIIQGKSKIVSDPMNIAIKNNFPAPGSYAPQINLNKYGVYHISTMKNSRAAKWSPSKKRFIDDNRHKKRFPGPAAYNPSDYNNSIGYVLSNNINHGSIKMKRDQNIKNQKFREQTPGPGSYMPPSEFGYLDLYKYSSPRQSISPRTHTSQIQSRNASVMGNTRSNQINSNLTNYQQTDYQSTKTKKFKVRRNSQMAKTYQAATITNANTQSNYTNMVQSDADKQNMPINHYSMTGTSTPAEYSGR